MSKPSKNLEGRKVRLIKCNDSYSKLEPGTTGVVALVGVVVIQKYELLFSDLEVGTHEFGFIPRKKREDCDDEDMRYASHVRTVCRGKVRVVEGTLYVEVPED